MFKKGKLSLATGLCLWLQVGSAMAATETVQFKIASYNPENLWDDDSENTPQVWANFLQTHSSLLKNETSEFQDIQYTDYSLKASNWYEPQVTAKKIANFLEVLRLVDYPSIVALQELESAGNFSKVLSLKSDGSTLAKKLELIGYKYFYLGQQELGNPVSVTPAVISKFELKSLPPIVIAGGTYSPSARNIQVLELKIKDSRLLLMNGHWKSKRNGGNNEARNETARLVVARMEREKSADSKLGFVVLGDLNAEYEEACMKILGNSSNKEAVKRIDSSLLYSLWYELPPDQRWENVFDGERKNLSNMLLSGALIQNSGLHYVDGSFQVVGQRGEAARTLLDPDGSPFRWQILPLKSKAIHIGQGYSDHLPLVASFRYDQESSVVKQDLSEVSSEKTAPTEKFVNFPEIKRCRDDEILDYMPGFQESAESLYGKCLRVEAQTGEEALPLKVQGFHALNFVSLTTNNGELRLGLIMNRSYDWRPNIDDSRVDRVSSSRTPEAYNTSYGHPRSNRCYTRKVLQGAGGSLRKAIGRVGYSGGRLQLFIASRESANLVLEDLPSSKKDACAW
ncbi:MAG: hypothetical protein KA436_10705 [Oligoflexales bacterium]|nr:hypothetical protein [Oligoflexales bacterium]